METKLTDTQIKERLLAATEGAKQGELDIAIMRLKEILNAQPRHEISLGMLASIYLQIGMNAQAVEYFERLLTDFAHNPLARFQLGMAKMADQQPEQALTYEPIIH